MLGLLQAALLASLSFACSFAGGWLADRLSTDKDCQCSITGTVTSHYEGWVLIGIFFCYHLQTLRLWYGGAPSRGKSRCASAAAPA